MNTFDYGGLTWEYDGNTVFLLELGRYQNTYKKSREFQDVMEAIAFYESMNVSLGRKKRLVRLKDGTRTTIARQTSRRFAK
jgi:hypothetical protein